MTRRIADAPQAYILRNEWNPYRFRVTLDLDVAVAEAIRDGHDRVHNLIQAYGTAALVGDLDSPRAPEVLALPLGTMAKLSAPQHIYADRYVRKHRIAVWGKVDEPVTDAEVQVVLDRARYRAENRDMPDPLIETMEAEERNLPPRPRNVDPVYVVIDRRRIGVFTTYEDAMGQSKDRAVITQVAANGIDRVHEGKTLRGWFWAGGRRAWGFASGYSPNDRARRGK